MRELVIEKMTFGADALGHVEGRAVLVRGAAPGDTIAVEGFSEQRNYSRARNFKLLGAGAARRTPPCRYLPECGGCDWQHLAYAAQLKEKSALLADEFRRALGVALDPDNLVEPCPREFGYRSRVRLKANRDGAIGFHQAGSNRLAPITECLLTTVALAPAQRLARALPCVELEVIAAAGRQVIVAYSAMAAARVAPIAEKFIAAETEVAGVIVRSGGRRYCAGHVAISYEPEPGCRIEADADSFSQVNASQNQALCAAVMELAGIESGAAVLDLFCGAGNFSLPAARRGGVVTGVDGDTAAIAAAQRNAQRMGIENATFSAMDAVEGVRFLQRAQYRPRLVLLDPPRSGAAALIEDLAALRAPRVLYISCDPATATRDLRRLCAHGYRMGAVRGFDFFPQTHHIETLIEVLLT